jgi:hypothetical protein
MKTLIDSTTAKLELIASHQTVSPKAEDVSIPYDKPSLGLFNEMVWDRTDNLGMTDEEVRDLAIWAGHKFLGFSQRALAQSWDVTRGKVIAILQNFERRAHKPQGEVDIQNACLVTAMGL